jgi:hypothetical protein
MLHWDQLEAGVRDDGCPPSAIFPRPALLVFISFTETDARVLREAKQRKTEEECGNHE